MHFTMDCFLSTYTGNPFMSEEAFKTSFLNPLNTFISLHADLNWILVYNGWTSDAASVTITDGNSGYGFTIELYSTSNGAAIRFREKDEESPLEGTEWFAYAPFRKDLYLRVLPIQGDGYIIYVDQNNEDVKAISGFMAVVDNGDGTHEIIAVGDSQKIHHNNGVGFGFPYNTGTQLSSLPYSISKTSFAIQLNKLFDISAGNFINSIYVASVSASAQNSTTYSSCLVSRLVRVENRYFVLVYLPLTSQVSSANQAPLAFECTDKIAS